MGKIKYEVKSILQEIVSYWNVKFNVKNKPKSQFIIFGQGRTGSNLLRTLLASHPEIKAQGEILFRNYIGVLFPKLYLKGRSVGFSKNIVYGFQLQPYHLKFHKIEMADFLPDLYENGWRIIYLKRANLFRQILSSKLAIHRKQWHYKNNALSSTTSKIKIKGEELLKQIEQTENNYLKEKSVLDKLSYIEVVYEEDLEMSSQHQKTANRIFDFLALSPVTVETQLVKSPIKIEEFVENYEEIVSLLQTTKYSSFLE